MAACPGEAGAGRRSRRRATPWDPAPRASRGLGRTVIAPTRRARGPDPLWPLSPLETLWCAAALFAGYATRGVAGFGSGVVATPLLTYELQDAGLDTVDAQIALGLPIDARDYAAAAGVLVDLGLEAVRVLTNNPAKVTGLKEHGIQVLATEPLALAPLPTNVDYLRTKRDRLGHAILADHDPATPTEGGPR